MNLPKSEILKRIRDLTLLTDVAEEDVQKLVEDITGEELTVKLPPDIDPSKTYVMVWAVGFPNDLVILPAGSLDAYNVSMPSGKATPILQAVFRRHLAHHHLLITTTL